MPVLFYSKPVAFLLAGGHGNTNFTQPDQHGYPVALICIGAAVVIAILCAIIEILE
jgi:hypothetical protein